jgi:outer membrane protein assembly factor BamD (BamD/ComL family)
VLAYIPLYSASEQEEKSFSALQKSFYVKDKDEFDKECNLFLKNYPKSDYVPDVRLLSADKETDVELSVKKYSSIVANYGRFAGREYAQYRICQILDLRSKWKELKSETAKGIKLFPNGRYNTDFRFMHIAALIMLEEYNNAKEEIIKITEKSRELETLCLAISYLAEIEKKRSGNAKPYLNNLKELADGFKKSEIYPSILFCLCLFYDEKKDYDKAFSAYSDVVKMYPASPEADMSAAGIERIKKFNPKKTAYIPDIKAIKNTDNIDISPEHDINKDANANFFSVAIGPFTRSNDADSVLKLVKDYDEVRKIKLAYGYMIYLGEYRDTDNALAARIRLAEEYGINGNIVRFSVQGSKSYIYEDR